MILAQHGWAKTNRIETGLTEGTVGGVVVSPKDMGLGSLETYMRQLAIDYPQADIYFDPQFYATVFDNRKIGKLDQYPYFPSRPLRRGQLSNASGVRPHVERTLDYQMLRPVKALISPSIMTDSLSDRWHRIAMTFASESAAYHSVRGFNKDLLITTAIDESCLRDLNAVENFLDELTSLDVAGFYIVIRRDGMVYPAATDSVALTNLLFLVYSLSELNEYRVICGYSDFIGLALVAVGGQSMATGWYHTLRQFTMRRWQISTGGSPANPRYSSGPLINSVLVSPEMDALFDANMHTRVISGTSRDGDFVASRGSSVVWTEQQSQLHHWEVLQALHSDIVAAGVLQNRIDLLKNKVELALDIYDDADAAGVTFRAESGRRELNTMSESLEDFEDLI